MTFVRYPPTQHLEGSRLPPGQRDPRQVPYAAIAGRWIVVEEKLDGTEAGVGFDGAANIQIQNHGHLVQPGSRESRFDILRQWVTARDADLYSVLEGRYLMFGEWLYLKKTVFYDELPHFFLEFHLYDRARQLFLSTAARRRLLANTPIVCVPVLYEGPAPARLEDLVSLLAFSKAKSPNWQANLAVEALRAGVDAANAERTTSLDSGMEGLYIKVEEGDWTVKWLKWVRYEFLRAILDSDTHWQHRSELRNRLKLGTDLFA